MSIDESGADFTKNLCLSDRQPFTGTVESYSPDGLPRRDVTVSADVRNALDRDHRPDRTPESERRYVRASAIRVRQRDPNGQLRHDLVGDARGIAAFLWTEAGSLTGQHVRGLSA